MQISHPLFGTLEYDDYEGYKTKTTVVFSGSEAEVELVLSEIFGNGGMEQGHSEAYEALRANWNTIVPDVLQAILEYQNAAWGSTDHTQSFPKFETVEDVLKNTTLTRITLEAASPPQWEEKGRYARLLFDAGWVNDDYRLLTVALRNEKVVQVSDQDI